MNGFFAPFACSNWVTALTSVHYYSIHYSNLVICVKYFLTYTSINLYYAIYKITVCVYNREREDKVFV